MELKSFKDEKTMEHIFVFKVNCFDLTMVSLTPLEVKRLKAADDGKVSYKLDALADLARRIEMGRQ